MTRSPAILLALGRLLAIPIVVWAVVTVTFVTLRLVPGDPVMYRAAQALTPEQIARFREQWGLDQPVWRQYMVFARQLARGDLGQSLSSGRPIPELLAKAYPVTIELAVAAAALGFGGGIVLGIVAALRPGGLADVTIRFLSALFFSIPWYWLALILIMVFAVWLRWLPVAGLVSASIRIPPRTHFMTVDAILAGDRRAVWSVVQHLTLPAVSLSLFVVGYLARITRSQMLDVLGADFVRTARAKGLREVWILGRHVLANAILPIVTVCGVQFGQLLAGSLITERVFARPGVSTLLLQGITERDYPVVQGTIMTVAATYVVVNALVDLAYGLLDPRTRR